MLFFGAAKQATSQTASAPTGKFTITQLEDKVVVKINGKIFTEYRYGKKMAKPILWPIMGPTDQNMVRNFPIDSTKKNEAHDHPHHAGLWFGHMPINGVNFWHYQGKHGKQVLQKIKTKIVDDKASIKASHNWVDSKGKIICTDFREIIFQAQGSSRIIEYRISLIASHGPITIGDDKEGTMAIRTHPALRIKGKHARGHAVNSQGDKDANLWGKNAKWVDYWAPINGKTVGVAIFDHPDNFRHPTTWHARDYGLIAANPFGLHYFKRKPKNTGNYTVKKNKALVLRYRFVFHKGDAKQAKIKQLYEQWVGDSATEKN